MSSCGVGGLPVACRGLSRGVKWGTFGSGAKIADSAGFLPAFAGGTNALGNIRGGFQ